MFETIARMAAGQHGVFATEEAFEHGATRRQVDRWVTTGHCSRLAEDVYRVTGAPITWESKLLAACLTDRNALASHRSAARLWRLDGFDRVEHIEITVPFKSWNGSFQGAVTHRSRAAGNFERRHVDGIPLTTPEMTLLQLGAVVQPELVEHALDSAVRLGLTTLPRLRWELQRSGRRGRNGTAVLRALLEARDESPVPESVLERKFVRLLSAHKVESAELQWEVRTGIRLVARVDAAWPERKVLVELDGDRYHATKQQRSAERRRDQELHALGFDVLHFDWSDVTATPERTIGILRSVLCSHNDLNGGPDSTKREGSA